MNTSAVVAASLAGLMLAAAVGAAEPLDVPTLQRLLQAAPKRALRFEELRESPWLAAPVRSSGRLRFDATMLERRVEVPQAQTWRILPDRMQLVGQAGDVSSELLFSAAPAVGELANALRLALTGDLHALQRDFEIASAGERAAWTLRLTPRHRQTARFLQSIELQGSGAELQVIIVVEGQGERTTTRLDPEP